MGRLGLINSLLSHLVLPEPLLTGLYADDKLDVSDIPCRDGFLCLSIFKILCVVAYSLESPPLLPLMWKAAALQRHPSPPGPTVFLQQGAAVAHFWCSGQGGVLWGALWGGACRRKPIEWKS